MNTENSAKKQISAKELERRAIQSAQDKAASTGTKKGNKKNVQSSNAPKVTQKKSLLNPLALNALKHELDLETSVSHNLQTLFNPRIGAHRPFSEGYEETALVSWESTWTVNGFTSTNNALTFAICPTLAGAIDQASWTFCPGSALANPITDSVGLAYPGPFYSSNPSKAYRTVSFELTITPIGPNMDLAGAGCMCYMPKSWITTGGGTNWAGAVGLFEKQKYTHTFVGSDKVIAHWLPNQVETEIAVYPPSVGNGAPSSTYSGILGYYICPNGVAADQAFRFDVRQVIEYVPSDAYYPYVGVSSSSMLPTTDHYVARAFMSYANPLVFGRYDDWYKLLSDWPSLGGHAQFEAHHGAATMRAANPQLGGNRRAFEQVPVPQSEEPLTRRADLDREDEERKEGPPPSALGNRQSNLVTGITTAVNVGRAVAGDPLPLLNQIATAALGGQVTTEPSLDMTAEVIPE